MIGKGPAGFTPVTEYTDFRGVTIVEGDTVVYAVLSGRSAQLAEATVVGIAMSAQHWRKVDDGGEWYWDRIAYDDMYQDPNRRFVRFNERTEYYHDFKLQLKPTGRFGRWDSNYGAKVKNPATGKWELSPDGYKNRWVMAEQATKV